jgi:hypothetical protein
MTHFFATEQNLFFHILHININDFISFHLQILFFYIHISNFKFIFYVLKLTISNHIANDTLYTIFSSKGKA